MMTFRIDDEMFVRFLPPMKRNCFVLGETRALVYVVVLLLEEYVSL